MTTCTCAECAPIRAELDSLRTATQLAQARADVRDASKRETAGLLGLPVDASVHQILGAIRAVVEDREQMRLALEAMVARVRRIGGYAEPEEQRALWEAERVLRR